MYKLHAFAQSGNTFKVALLLQALRQPWTPIHLPFEEFAKGIQRSDAWREDVNPMGEIPVLETGDRKLTQSAVIMIHLAEKHGAYAGTSEDERLEVLRWMFFDNHKFTSYLATLRFLKSFGATAPDPAVMKFSPAASTTRSALWRSICRAATTSWVRSRPSRTCPCADTSITRPTRAATTSPRATPRWRGGWDV